MMAFLFRRFRWMLIGAAGKEVARRVSQRQVDEATSDLADRLPERAVNVANMLPGDVLRAAGTAQVAGRTARRSAQVSMNVASLTKDVAASPQRARQRLGEMGDEWSAQVADDDRTFRARLIAQTRGMTAATDALLGGRTSWEDLPLPEVPDSVEPGRREPTRRDRLVQRVQRTYRPRKHQWQD